MSTVLQGDVSVEIIGGFPKPMGSSNDDASIQSSAKGSYDEANSTAWAIQPPSSTVPAPSSPEKPSGYTFGSNMGSFSYGQPHQTAFGTDQSRSRTGSRWGSPNSSTRTPRAGAFKTPQRQRDIPPHIPGQAGTPPGLNQTGIPFDPSRTMPITSTAAQPKGKEVSKLPQSTRRVATVRKVKNAETGEEEDLIVEKVAVDILADIDGPLSGILQHEICYNKTYVEFFASLDSSILQNYPVYAKELMDRREEVFNLGKKYLAQRKHSNSYLEDKRQLTSKERDDMKDILQDLDELLKALDRYEDDYFVGYKMNAARFRKFNKQLLERRALAKDVMIVSGVGIPELPCWGLDGNVNEYWEGNDFEILATMYRHEVLQYLTNISRTMEAASDVSDIDEKTEEVKSEEKSSLFRNTPTPIAARIQQFTNQNASIFGNPSKNTSSKKLADMLTSNRTMNMDQTEDRRDEKKKSDKDDQPRASGGSEDPKNPNGGSQKGKLGTSSTGGGGSGGGGNGAGAVATVMPHATGRAPMLPQFDNKLKVEIIPTWDGNPDELGRWILKINRLAERSSLVFQQLGYLVPTRLTGAAELWYYSQSAATRAKIEENWGTLRTVIAGYFMNRSFLEKQRIRANKARYRDAGNLQETPSEYFIRKLELLEIVYNYSEGELINEIMAGAPTYWSTVLTPHLYDTIEGFQMAVKFQEDNLLRMGYDAYRVRQEYGLGNRDFTRNPFSNYRKPPMDVKTNAVGWTQKGGTPPFPKDDGNVSPRGTPVSKGGRPCRHCGSENHWDPECKYAQRGEKRARTNAAMTDPDDVRAQREYDDLFYSLVTEDSEDEMDFH